MSLRRGKIVVNDEHRVVVEFEDGSSVECRKREHDYDLFPVGEDVNCSDRAIFKDSAEGYTFIPVDQLK